MGESSPTARASPWGISRGVGLIPGEWSLVSRGVNDKPCYLKSLDTYSTSFEPPPEATLSNVSVNQRTASNNEKQTTYAIFVRDDEKDRQFMWYGNEWELKVLASKGDRLLGQVASDMNLDTNEFRSNHISLPTGRDGKIEFWHESQQGKMYTKSRLTGRRFPEGWVEHTFDHSIPEHRERALELTRLMEDHRELATKPEITKQSINVDGDSISWTISDESEVTHDDQSTSQTPNDRLYKVT